MNRIEFMTQLAALLQDVPVEERREAMRYYNDYFDEAGAENEAQAVSELGSPAQVAARIKEDLGGWQRQSGTGNPEEANAGNGAFGPQPGMGTGEVPQGSPVQPEPAKTNKTVKTILIILAIIGGVSIVLPAVLGILGGVIGLVAGLIGLFISLVLIFAAFAVMGVCMVCAGIVSLIPEVAVGLALIGTGLIFTVVGVVGIVGIVKLCMVAVPAAGRGIRKLYRKVFPRKAVA